MKQAECVACGVLRDVSQGELDERTVQACACGNGSYRLHEVQDLTPDEEE